MILIENTRVINFNPLSISEPLDVVIDGAHIKEIGSGLAARYPQAEKISSPYISPGLVCSHNHFYSALARGLMAPVPPSKDFVQQLNNLWWRLDRALDADMIRASGIAGALHAIRHGVTAVIDHHASPNCIEGSLDHLAAGFELSGLRGVLCYETTDRYGNQGAEAGVAENIRFSKKTAHNPLLRGAIGAHAPFTVNNTVLALLTEAVRETGAGLHIHAAEDKFDAVHSRYQYGLDIVDRLERAEILSPKTIIAHGLYLTASEIETLNRHDAFLVHNARSNMNNHVGYNEALHLYKNVALGTDGIGSDMVTETICAFYKHRDAGGPLYMDTFLGMLWNGNELLNRYFPENKFGYIAPGYAADITFWDYEPPTPLIPENLMGHMAFGLSPAYISGTMIAGKLVMKNRTIQFDTATLLKETQNQARRLWKAMEAI
ncbi:MAG TPA: putative aminohydrolase SsnA [Spirochaetia bacterium]|nr:putative aminohydrolase SsnA [Spirochaetia bacterium]